MIVGPIVAVVWYFTLKNTTGIYEGGPAFLIALVVIWIVSLFTKNDIPKIDDDWDRYSKKCGAGTPMPLASDVEAYKEALAKINVCTKTQNDIIEILAKNKIVTPTSCSVISK